MGVASGTRSLIKKALSAWHIRLDPDDPKPAVAHFTTAPRDRISFPLKLAYGAGAFVNNLLAAAIGGMLIVLNLGLGMNPAMVGLVGALPRITDALTDPMMGYISDHTRSRWGRRRPYIFVGAIASGLVFCAAVAGAERPQRHLLLLVLPRRVQHLLPGLHGLRDALGGAGLRADPRLPRANPAHGGAELHRAARLRGGPLVPLDHDVQALVPGPGSGRGDAGARHRGLRRGPGHPARHLPPGALPADRPDRGGAGQGQGGWWPRQEHDGTSSRA